MPSEPRAYGEPTDRGYEQAMDALTDVVAYYRGADYRDWKAGALRTMEQTGRETELTFAMDGQADNSVYPQVLAALQDAAPTSEPCYVQDDALEVIEAACSGLPTVAMRPWDIPWERGFVYLPRPLAGRMPEGEVVAFSWVVSNSLRPYPCIATMAYTQERGRVVCARPGFLPLAGDPPEVWDESEGGAVGLVILIASFFLLAQQRLFKTSQAKPSRAVRRRAIGREIQTVRVITLRVADYPETDGTRTVDWSHRWLVRGHWRQQWIASEQRHRPTWVNPHVKGPANKPFVAKHRAFEFVR